MKKKENLKSSNCNQETQNSSTELCVICGKTLPERRVHQGKSTCSASCAQRLAQNRPEVSAKRSASLKRVEKEVQNRQSTKEKKSNSMKNVWATEGQKQKFSEAQRLAQNRPEVSKKKSMSSKRFYQIEENRKRLQEIRNSSDVYNRIKQTNIETWSLEEKRKEHSELMKIVQNAPGVNEKRSNSLKKYLSIPENLKRHNEATHSPSAIEKANRTKKKNNTCKRSSWEDASYNELMTVFHKNDVVRWYVEHEKYRFECDFYIKSLDALIECHYGMAHQPDLGAFDKNNKEHNERLIQLTAKADAHRTPKYNKYRNAIYQWTDLDVRKRQCAIDNKLNWLCFYTREDFTTWLNTIKLQASTKE